MASPLSGFRLRLTKKSAQLLSPLPCIMLRTYSCKRLTSADFGMPFRSSYSSHRRSTQLLREPPWDLSLMIDSVVASSPYFLKTMFLRNHTLKQRRRIETMPALKVFSKRVSCLTPVCFNTVNLSMAQPALRSSVSFNTALETSSQVYFLDTAKRQRNSPRLGHAILLRKLSSLTKLAIFRSTCSCNRGNCLRIDSNR